MTSFADPGSGAPQGPESRSVNVDLNADVSGYTQAIGEAQQQTSALVGTISHLSSSLGSLVRSAGKSLIHFGASDFAGLSAATADAASLEHQLGTLRATSVVTGTSMDEMKGQLDDAFSKFPMARSQIIQLAETINNLGVTAPKAVGSMVTTFAKLGAATGEDPSSLAASSLQVDRQMGNMDPDAVAKYANSLLTVSKNQGVAASGVNDFASAIAPMARAAGIGQAAIYGISAAFQKAGADGGRAATAFNTIIGDITQATETDSADLQKYASFAGKTREQFEKMTGTEKFTSMFQSISKGGPDALAFMNQLGMGTQGLRAVQAVGQSGGLSQAIAEATGGASNTDNLDKASKSAMSGLTDSLIETGNQFTKLGEIIGGPMLAVLTPIISLFNKALGAVTSWVSAMGPIPAILGALAGGLATVAGLVMGKMGLIGALALARTALGPMSAGRAALREGRAAGEAIRGGATEAEAMAMSRSGRSVAAGDARWRTSVPYNYAMDRAARGPGVAAAAGGWFRQGAGAVGRFATGTSAWFMNDQARGLDDSRQGRWWRRSGAPGVDRTFPTWRESIQTGGGGLRGVAAAGRNMVGSTVMAAGSMAAATGNAALGFGMRSASGFTRGALATGQAVGRAGAWAGGRLAAGAGALGGALFSPLGMIATMVAVPLVSSLVSAIKEGNAERADISGSLTGAQKYDQALDRTSTNLARFGDAVDGASTRLAGLANTSPKDLTQVTGEDRNTVAGSDYKIADPNLQAVVQSASEAANRSGGTDEQKQQFVQDQIGSYLQGQGIQAGTVDGSLFTKYRRDVLKALDVTGGGGDQTELTNKIMGTFATQIDNSGKVIATPDFGAMGALAGGSYKFGDAEAFKSIMGAGVTSLKSATQNSGDAGIDARTVNMLGMASAATATGDVNQAGKLDQASTYLQKVLGIDPDTFKDAIHQAAKDLGTQTTEQVVSSSTGGTTAVQHDYGTVADSQRVNVRAFLSTKPGQDYLAAHPGMTEASLLSQVQNPGALPPPTASNSALALQQKGTLGAFAANANNGILTAADSGNAGSKFAAATTLVGEAAKEADGNMTQAIGNLTRLSDAIGGVAGELIKAAADWARYEQGLTTATLSREGQVQQAGKTAAEDMAAANPALHPSEATVAQAKQSQQAADTSRESYRQYMIGRMQTIVQFNTSQARAQEDYQLQLDHGWRDFNRQQARATDAFNLQKLNAQHDFQTQSLRSTEAYQLSVSRANEDHARDLARQAATAAQSIYDPYTRIQRKATTDAGTLIQNLTEQNRDIEAQLAQIAELKQKGLSQQAIDTLRLADPANAQQVNDLTQSLTQNPAMTAQINNLVGERLSATTALTQNTNNVDYRTTQEDFYRQMSRGATDFATQQAYALQDFQLGEQRAMDAFTLSEKNMVQDHTTALSDMAVALKTSQDRAAQDLLTSFTQYTGDFAAVYDQLVSTSITNVSNYGVQVGAVLSAELTKVKTENPWLFLPVGTNPMPSTTVVPYQGQYSTAPYQGQYSTAGAKAGHAYGGISLTQHTATISEHGPEMILPLNSRGENFMAGLIAKSLAKGITMATPADATATSSVSSDNSISFSGASIKVIAQDPNQMARQLAAKAKIARLASPVRH